MKLVLFFLLAACGDPVADMQQLRCECLFSDAPRIQACVDNSTHDGTCGMCEGLLDNPPEELDPPARCPEFRQMLRDCEDVVEACS